MTTPKPTEKRKTDPTAAAASERVKLERPHTHRGVDHKAGESITVAPDTADWLRSQGVVAKATAPSTTED